MTELLFEATQSTEELAIIENMKEVAENPGILTTYLEGMIPNLISFALQVVLAIVIYGISVKLIKWVIKIVQKGMERHGVDTGVNQFLCAIIKYALYLILIMTILSLFGIATTSVVAILGSAGVAVGLALQGSLANFAGGVLILLLKQN